MVDVDPVSAEFLQGPLVVADWATASVAGPYSANQDRALADGILFAAADGMGQGHGGGLAATVAISTLGAEFHRTNAPAADRLSAAAAAANGQVEAANERYGAAAGTTLCAVAVDDGELWVVSVGDSGALLVRSGQIHSLTQPDRDGHRLTQSLGRLTRPATVMRHELDPGDRVIVCTDGVLDFTENVEILIHASARSADAAARALTEAGIGHDDATAVVVDVAQQSLLLAPHWPGGLDQDAAGRHRPHLARLPTAAEEDH